MDERRAAYRVVALGGGTGLSAVLRGLKEHIAERGKHRTKQPIGDLTAVVTVTNDGGSSGRLRREYKVLPPGDIRNCLGVALSRDELLLGDLSSTGFPRDADWPGTASEICFSTALTNVTGDFPRAVQVSARVLADSRPDLSLDGAECDAGSGTRGRENRQGRNEHLAVAQTHRARQTGASPRAPAAGGCWQPCAKRT